MLMKNLQTNAWNEVELQQLENKNNIRTLNSLIDESKNLPTKFSELGPIQFNIDEIKKRAQNDKLKNDRRNDLTKAHYLLADGGLKVTDINSSIDKLKSDNQFLEQYNVTSLNKGELDDFLRTKKEQNILSSIESLLNEATDDFSKFVSSNIDMNWRDMKPLVYKNYGISVSNNKNIKPSAYSPLERPTWKHSTSSILDNNDYFSNLNVNENFIVRGNFENYARVIHRFNNARQHNSTFNLDNEIISMIEKSGEYMNKNIIESWRIIDSIYKHQSVVTGSRHYLEEQFLNYVNKLYQKKLNKGLPTNINKIKNFIEFKLKMPNGTWKIQNLTIANGTPIWALVFYLLRAGLKQEALEAIIVNQTSFEKVEGSFLAYFKAYAASKTDTLPPQYSTKLHAEYNQYIKSPLFGDPYRLAVYKILGRCDLTRKNIPNITLSLEDWIWMHLMLIKEDTSETDPIYERYTLSDFQDTILAFGKEHFQDNYFRSLMLSGLFESAIESSLSFSEIDGIHLAIGLVNKKLLNISDSLDQKSGSQLVVMEEQVRKFKFGKFLGNYVRSFKKSDPRIAVEYLILIALNGNEFQIKLCHAALRELILETREFDILLGTFNKDGTRIPGIIEKRQTLLFLNDKKEFLHIISEQTAEKARETGKIYDSITLYQLAEEYNVVTSIVKSLLGNLLCSTNLKQSLIGDYQDNIPNPIVLTENLVKMYVENLEISKKVDSRMIETCLTLLKIAEIRKLFINREWHNCLNQIIELGFLPIGDSSSPSKKAQELPSYDDDIIKNIPNILIIVMKCISKMVERLEQSQYQTAAKPQQITFLKNITKNCIVYAGMIQYRMPREVYSTLIKLDIGLI